MILPCKSLKHTNYRHWGDNLFISIATIHECYKLPQRTLLSSTVRKDCAGYPPIVKEHSKATKRKLNFSTGDCEAMFTSGPPAVVSVLWMDTEKTRFLGAGAR